MRCGHSLIGVLSAMTHILPIKNSSGSGSERCSAKRSSIVGYSAGSSSVAAAGCVSSVVASPSVDSVVSAVSVVSVVSVASVTSSVASVVSSAPSSYSLLPWIATSSTA